MKYVIDYSTITPVNEEVAEYLIQLLQLVLFVNWEEYNKDIPKGGGKSLQKENKTRGMLGEWRTR